MKALTTLVLLGLSTWYLPAQQSYSVEMDLRLLNNDQLDVTVELPRLDVDSAVFVFPTATPGSYRRVDWWRFVHNVKAMDSVGAALPVTRSTDFQFVIHHARRARWISYRIDDSFDDPRTEQSVFLPSGTSFQGDSVFVLNHCGIVGYIEGYQDLPYTVTIGRPQDLHCATALSVLHRDQEFDVYQASSYDELIDGPVLYARADTFSFRAGGIDAHIAVAGGKGRQSVNYSYVLAEVLDGLEDYLGEMPVSSYTFLIYLWDRDTSEVATGGIGLGALEHTTSSLYVLQRHPSVESLRSIATHEFLHVYCPLSIRTEPVDRFNYRFPIMSAHLWLYEGVTDYLSDQCLLRAGMLTEPGFVGRLNSYASALHLFPEGMTLCGFSRTILEPEVQPYYGMVYSVGTLYAALLDIKIRMETDREKGLLDVIKELSSRYQPGTPLSEDEVFSVIGTMSDPEVAAFLTSTLDGGEEIPLTRILAAAALDHDPAEERFSASFGVIWGGPAPNGRFYTLRPTGDNVLGVEPGDVLIAINDERYPKIKDATYDLLMDPSAGDQISIIVERDNRMLTLRGRAREMSLYVPDRISNDTFINRAQKKMRRAVLYGN